MTGWLLYTRQGAADNRWFIDRLIEAMRNLGADLRLIQAEHVRDLPLSVPDFAVVRLNDPGFARHLESKGVPVCNNYRTSFTANDKWETYRLAEKLGLPVMPTALWEEGTDLSALAYPLVAKAAGGKRGSQVFLAHSPAELQSLRSRLFPGRVLLQKFCDEPGKDMRVYMLGGTVYQGILRTSDTDFRSNYSLGGRAAAVEADCRQKEIIQALYEHLQFDFIGVDFIRDQGRWVLNEIEDPVGCRMLYASTKKDPAADLARYLLKRRSH